MFIIGVTGNIGTGKSTVDAMLADRKALVLDADALVRDLQRKNEPTWQRIVERFGRDVLQPDGELDRAKLAQLVFTNAAALRDLEEIVHPAVRQALREQVVHAAAGSILVVDAIKLIENRLAEGCDSIWVVTCRKDQQIQRLIAQRGMTADQARMRVDAQPPQEEKAQIADVVIDNSGTLETTRGAVAAAWSRTVEPWLVARQQSEG